MLSAAESLYCSMGGMNRSDGIVVLERSTPDVYCVERHAFSLTWSIKQSKSGPHIARDGVHAQ